MSQALKEKAPTAARIPWPSGYRMLLSIPAAENKTAGGIYKPEQLVDREQTASVYGLVVRMGPDCYKDEGKFPSGAWCKEGDFVVIRKFSGTRFKIDGQEFRLVNDDTIEAVVTDPRGMAAL